MGIFGFGKKNVEKTASCCCSCSSNVEEQPVNECCGQEVKGICCIKVLSEKEVIKILGGL